MIEIPYSIKKDYLSTSVLKNFCTDHKMKVSENKAELISEIIEYAGEEETTYNYKETFEWLLSSIRAGSKEFCYKKIYFTEDVDYESKILEKYSKSSKTNIMQYSNTTDFGLVDYQIIRNSEDRIIKVSLLFSKLVLEGPDIGESGEKSIYPVYIDLYIDEGFIVSREKAKSTIYEYCESEILVKENKIDTIEIAVTLLNEIIDLFELIQDSEKIVRSNIRKMLYNLYMKYSFVPTDVVNKIHSMEKLSKDYLINVFDTLDLNYANMPDAYKDLEIFLEKYISINGDIEHIFKEDREAYLVKISSDNVEDTTRFDSASALTVPLQCKPLFYDGKKNCNEIKRM